MTSRLKTGPNISAFCRKETTVIFKNKKCNSDQKIAFTQNRAFTRTLIYTRNIHYKVYLSNNSSVTLVFILDICRIVNKYNVQFILNTFFAITHCPLNIHGRHLSATHSVYENRPCGVIVFQTTKIQKMLNI